MKLLKLTLVLAVLSLWLGAANHCLLESVPAFKFLVCAAHEENASPQETNCEEDGCAAVEKAAYKPEQTTASAPIPVLFLVGELIAAGPEAVEPEVEVSQVHSASQLQLPSATWQFVLRTAAPPRAPSFLS